MQQVSKRRKIYVDLAIKNFKNRPCKTSYQQKLETPRLLTSAGKFK